MLDGRRILVTGGSRGIGAAIVQCIAGYGAAVAINYNRSREPAESLAESIRTRGGKALVVKADVSVEADVDQMIATTVGGLGGLDGLVNNAGVSFHRSLTEMSIADWDHIIKTNLRSMFLCSHGALEHLIASGRGKIINNSSMLQMVARYNLVAYTAAKAGVGGLTRALALELAARGVQVNSVCPGVIQTEILGDKLESDQEFRESVLSIIPARRVGTAAEVAELVAFLLSGRSDYITGASIPIDGGVLASRAS